MNEIPYVILAIGAGFLLGIFFFAGLWWTVKKATSSGHPALLFITSTIIRSCVILIGFYFVSGRYWERFLGCIVGFIIARIIVIRFTKLSTERQRLSQKEPN